MPRRQHPQWLNDSLLRLFRVLASIAVIGLGFSVLISGGDRMASQPSFTMLLQWAPWQAWGAGPVLVGLMTLSPRYMFQLAGYVLCSIHLWVWWTALLIGTLQSDKAPYTGIPVYFVLASAVTALTVSNWMERKR